MKRFILFIWLLVAGSAAAHQNSIAFLSLSQTETGLEGKWDIPLHDFEFAIGLDDDLDGDITWGEIQAKIPEIQKYAFDSLIIRDRDQRLEIELVDVLVENHVTGPSLVLMWQATVQERNSLKLQYDFQFDVDPGHQCVVDWKDKTTVLTREQRLFDLAGTNKKSGFTAFIRQGVVHIFAGIDHICFLVALLLPAVWKRTERGWEPAGGFRSALISVFKVVTAFTLAHSITLAIATLRVLELPSALVESVIAFSVVLAALNNIWPIWNERSWLVAFGFGLVHGFGFASVLSEIGLQMSSLLASLVGFNLGVELGQLCIVLIFLPLAFLLRETWFYRWCAVRLGSAGIAAVGTIWLVERVFHVTIF